MRIDVVANLNFALLERDKKRGSVLRCSASACNGTILSHNTFPTDQFMREFFTQQVIPWRLNSEIKQTRFARCNIISNLCENISGNNWRNIAILKKYNGWTFFYKFVSRLDIALESDQGAGRKEEAGRSINSRMDFPQSSCAGALSRFWDRSVYVACSIP